MKTIKNFNIPLVFITSLFITMMFSSCGKNYDSYYELIDSGMYQIAQEKILKEIEKDPTNGKLHQIFGDIKLSRFLSESFRDSVKFMAKQSWSVREKDLYEQVAKSIVESYQTALKYDEENELPLINSMILVFIEKEFYGTYGTPAMRTINGFIETNLEKSKGYDNAAIEYLRYASDNKEKYIYWDRFKKKISKKWIQIVEIDSAKSVKSATYGSFGSFIVLKDSIPFFYESGENAGYLTYGNQFNIFNRDEDYYYSQKYYYDRWNQQRSYNIKIKRNDVKLSNELEEFVVLADSVGFIDEEGNQAGFLKYGNCMMIGSETDERYIFPFDKQKCSVLKNDVSLVSEIFAAGINYKLLRSYIPKDILINLGHFKLAKGFPIFTIWDFKSSLALPLIIDSFKIDSKGNELIFHTEGNISKKIVVRNGIVESITDYSS